MPNNLKRSAVVANIEADGVVALLNNGYLRLYSTPQPAGADVAITTQTLLAELRFNAPAAPAASNGVATFNPLTPDASANATGTATWFRVLKSDGVTVVFDGSVGVSGCDLNMNSTAIQIAATVDVTAFSYTANKG